MRSIKIILLILTCAWTLGGCKSLHYDEFRDQHSLQIDSRIPPLVYQDHDRTIRYNNRSSGYRYVQGRLFLVPDLYDMVFDSEYSTRYGYAEYTREGELVRTGSGLTWVLLSGFTLGTLNLIGMPFTQKKSQQRLVLTLYDAQRNKIKTYTSKTYDASAHAAFYWGYSNPGPVAEMRALMGAHNDIKRQLENDGPAVSRQLIAGGDVESTVDKIDSTLHGYIEGHTTWSHHRQNTDPTWKIYMAALNVNLSPSEGFSMLWEDEDKEETSTPLAPGSGVAVGEWNALLMVGSHVEPLATLEFKGTHDGISPQQLSIRNFIDEDMPLEGTLTKISFVQERNERE